MQTPQSIFVGAALIVLNKGQVQSRVQTKSGLIKTFKEITPIVVKDLGLYGQDSV
jgi:hypothetical protein